MKRIICLILSLLMCVFILSFTVNAQGSNVVDEADLLTSQEEAELQNTINQIQSEFRFDVVILTVDSTEGKSPEAYADDYYDYNGYGVDDKNSGVLFLVDIGDREWSFSTTGRGIELIADPELDYIEQEIIPVLSQGEYYQCFSLFVSACEDILQADINGESFLDGYDVEQGFYNDDFAHDDGYSEDVYYYSPVKFNFVKNIFISLVIGFIIALVIVLNMKSKLKTVRPRSGASEYVVAGSMNVTRSHERFLYRNVTRTPRQQNNSNNRSGGGGGVRIGSSGTSHGGRSGKF